MSDNDYVATAAAEKRLREVLADRLPGATTGNVEDLAVVLLDGARIEYKARSKQVVISLDLPDTATNKRPKPSEQEIHDGATGSAEYGAPPEPEPEITPGPPVPHVAPFVPVPVEPDYDDVHFD